MSRPQARITIGLPHLGHEVDKQKFTAETQTDLQLAFEVTQRNLAERTDNQRRVNQTSGPVTVFKPVQQILLYSHITTRTDLTRDCFAHGVSPKQSRHTASRVSSPTSPGDSGDFSVHFAHLKHCRK